MKGICKYCGKKIPEVCIRCCDCDMTWQEGFTEGERSMRAKIREIFKALYKLCGFEE